MAWFRNHYVCTACEGHWIAESAEAIEAHCPHCRVYDVVPYRSDDIAARDVSITVATPEVTDKELVVALKATAAKMRGAAERPRGRRVTARAVLH